MHTRFRSTLAVFGALALAACTSAPAGSPAGTSAGATQPAATSAAATLSSSTGAPASASAGATTAAETPLPPPGGSLIEGCASGSTKGPNGETGAPTSELTLSEAEAEQVRSGDYTAAILWHTSGDFVNAVSRGIKDTFADLNVEVISETDAAVDAATQASQVETIMARDPDIVITLVEPSGDVLT